MVASARLLGSTDSLPGRSLLHLLGRLWRRVLFHQCFVEDLGIPVAKSFVDDLAAVCPHVLLNVGIDLFKHVRIDRDGDPRTVSLYHVSLPPCDYEMSDTDADMVPRGMVVVKMGPVEPKTDSYNVYSFA